MIRQEHAIKLKLMANQGKAQFFRQRDLHGFKFGIIKFGDFAGFNIDQVVVMVITRLFVA